MPINDELGKRMKENYEERSRTKLTRRTPVAIRIDGRSFHTFTRGLEKPFDNILVCSMQETMKYLCANIQGCVFGYTQSDEITLILIDYQTLTTDAWFDYQIQKICSISASMATKIFNNTFNELANTYIATKIFNKTFNELANTYLDDLNEVWNISEKEKKYEKTLIKCKTVGAEFDARCFNIPKEEVTNLIYWRQLDATRNSIEMVGHANFSPSQLHKKSCSNIQDMLMLEKGINWNDLPTELKRGSACYKSDNGWIVDHEMPILKGEDREYVDKWINIGE